MNPNMNVEKPELVEVIANNLGSITGFYFKAHGAHFNVAGPDFSEFHGFFAMLYEDALEQIDTQGEFLRFLGAQSPCCLNDYVGLNSLPDMDTANDPMLMVQDLYEANNIMIELVNNAFKIATELDEQGIANYFAERDGAHKKWKWQLQMFMSGSRPSVRSMGYRLGKADAAQPLIADDILEEEDTPVVEQLMGDENGCPLCGPGIGCVCPGCEGGHCLCDDNCPCPECHVTMMYTDDTLTAAGENSCPAATQDIQLNLKNRQNAIDNVGYGPLNPNEPNDEFWQEKADKWKTTVEEAKTTLCANCVFFIRTPQMLDCISSGIQQGGSSSNDADAAIDQAELGYCEALDFKCAASRTCNAWAVGGPITAASSRPAPKKDRIYGSKKNPKGSAAGGKKIMFSDKTENALAAKVQEHNKDAKAGRKATLPMLKAVYRRGAGAYSSSHRPGKTRDQWAMARVNAFLKLLRSGSPANPNYKQDNDLLPKAHPKSTKAEASLIHHELLQVALKNADEYGSPEHAIFSMAEYSGLGYEVIPALRGAWLRGVRDGDVPFNRAYELATKLYASKDADLLPKKRRGDK